MKKIIVLLISFSFINLLATAQDSNSSDSTNSKRKSHRWVQLGGIQANALVQQLFNFGNASNTVTNPYLLTYSAFSTKSKLGVDIGLGYTLDNTNNNSGDTKSVIHNNDLNCRLGLQKIYPFNRRITATGALHVLYTFHRSDVTTEQNFNSQYTKITSISNNRYVGFGPTVGLRYRLSRRVWIGTEASYYGKVGNKKSTITQFTQFVGQIEGTTTSQKVDNNVSDIKLNVPAAIFLLVRL